MNNLLNLSSKSRKVYHETPPNWDTELKSNFICDPHDCIDLIQIATSENKVIAFIDTCTIIKIAKMSDNTKIAKMIANEYNLLIFTAEVIKELSSQTIDEHGNEVISSKWTDEEEEFIKSLKYEGATILYLDENTLTEYILSTAVTPELVSKRTSRLYWLLSKQSGNKLNILHETDTKFNEELLPNKYSGSNYLLDLIVYLKSKKCEGDSLAELLLIILINNWLKNDMPFVHFISDDRKTDVLIQLVHDFQLSLKKIKYLSETRFMGRIEAISFVKKAVDNNIINEDVEIIEYCKPYLSDEGYVITITGGRFISKEKLTVSESMLLMYMNDMAIQVHATSNLNQVIKYTEWDAN